MAASNGGRRRLPPGKALQLIFALALLAWVVLILVGTAVWVVCDDLLLWRQPAAPITGVDIPQTLPPGPPPRGNH